MIAPNAAPDYGSAVFAGWRGAAADEWQAYTRHAFVRGLGDGSLPPGAFLHYLVQDYIFLANFARAWALGVVKAGDLEEMRAAAATVDALVNQEMALHVKTCAAAGISEKRLLAAEEEIENLAYTRFVLDAGLSGDFLDLLAALAPCVLGYGEIGAGLRGAHAPDTPYRAWIETYAGREYQDVCRATAGFLETVAARRIGPDPTRSPRWPGLAARFRTACHLEARFWDMGLDAAAA
jgi:thiaminase (transcriptional activator TenA)